MKVLSLTQPWATLVAIGAKQFETRSWSTRYRGPLAIHAAKGFPKDCQELCESQPFLGALARAGFPSFRDLPRGQIIASCVLDDVLTTSFVAALPGFTESTEYYFGDYGPGRFAFKLTNIQELSIPLTARGALGLWETKLL